MTSYRNAILLLLCSSIFIVTGYSVFFKSSQKQFGLDEVYLDFTNSVSEKRPDTSAAQLVLKELSDNSNFNYCGTAGYSGEKIPIINPALLFQRTFSESQLIALCQKSGPVIKHFAFKALVQVNFESAKILFERQITDSTVIDYQCACMGTLISIPIDFLNSLRHKLSAVDREAYLKKAKKYCSPFVYAKSVEFFNL